MTRNEVDVNQLLVEDYKVKDSNYNGRYTKSALFLLPMIELDLKNKLLLKYLDNVYLDDKGIEHDYSRPLFLLFKVPNYTEKNWIELQRMFKTKLKNYLVHSYYVGEDALFRSNLVMFVFQTPTELATDYYHFKAGRYSKFSKQYKDKFAKMASVNGKVSESIAYGAINKTSALKDKIALEFTIKDDKGNPISKVDYVEFRNFVEELDEIWDAPVKEEEYYRLNK